MMLLRTIMMHPTSIRHGSIPEVATRARGANGRRPYRADVAAIRHILVPLAGSEQDAAAVSTARTLARLHRASVSLVHVLEPSCDRGRHGVLAIAGAPTRGAPPDVSGRAPRPETAEWKAARDMLARVAVRFADAQIWVTCIVVAGPRACSIVRTAERIGADLIVMNRRGTSSAAGNHGLGSTSDAVAATARCAVTLVRAPSTRTTRNADRTIRTQSR